MKDVIYLTIILVILILALAHTSVIQAQFSRYGYTEKALDNAMRRFNLSAGEASYILSQTCNPKE